MKKLLYLFLMFIALNAFAESNKEVKKEVTKVYHQWCKAIGEAKGDASVVVKFYAPGALLLPTLSGKLLENTNGGLNEYFEKLTSLPKVECEPEKSSIHVHDNIVVNSGFYEFSYLKDGKKVEIPARFTFTYRKVGDQWMIINHHSSKMPE